MDDVRFDSDPAVGLQVRAATAPEQLRELLELALAEGDLAGAALVAAELPFEIVVRAVGGEMLVALANAVRLGESTPDACDVEALLEQLREEPDRSDVQRRLSVIEGHLLQSKNYELLIELYAGRAALESSASRRAATMIDLATLLEHEVGDSDRAMRARLVAYSDAPDRGSWPHLERLAAVSGRWSELVDTLFAGAPRLRQADQVPAWIEVARLAELRLKEPARALAAVDAALELQPQDAGALNARIRALRSLERWEDLCEAIAARAEVAEDPVARGALHHELGSVWETRLGNDTQALRWYRRALQDDAGSDVARGALEALLRRGGYHAELVRVLEHRLPEADEVELRALRRELATLCEMQLGDREAAIRHWQAQRAAAPMETETLRALARLYQKQGAAHDQVAALSDLAGLVDDTAERAVIYNELARAWERAGDRAKVEECLEWVLTFDPENLEAFGELERLYRSDRRWRAAIDVYGRHADVAPRQDRPALFVQVAGIYEQELDDPGRAIDLYRKALELAADNVEALTAIAQLHETNDAAIDARETWERVAECTDDVALRADALAHAGRLCDEPDAAAALLRRALDDEPGHAAAARSLARVHAARGKALAAASVLANAAKQAGSRKAQLSLLVDAGAHYEEADTAAASSVYEQALALDSGCVEALARLSEMYWRDGRYVDLLPVQQRLAIAPAAVEVRVARLLRLARVTSELGLTHQMIEAYGVAADLAPDDVEIQRAYCELLFEGKKWATARPVLRRLVAEDADELSAPEVLELRYMLAVCSLELGEPETARPDIDAALASAPVHRPSLLLALRLDNPPPVVEATKRALLASASPAESAELWADIGDLRAQDLGDAAAAMVAYRESLELEPDNHRVLHRMLGMQVERSQWSDALATLAQLAAVERAPAVRARYRNTAAMICRDELDRPEDAIGLLWQALEDDPSLKRAAESLEELLRALDSDDRLIDYYTVALERLNSDASAPAKAERLRLWSALGDRLLGHSGRREEALSALAVAAHLDADNANRHVQLASLYDAAGEEHVNAAIAEHQWLLRDDHGRAESYRALEALNRRAGRERETSACAAAVAALDYRPREAAASLPVLARPLGHAQWGLLRDPTEQRSLSALLATIAPVLAVGRARSLRQHGLSSRDALDRSRDDAVGRAWAAVSVAIGADKIRAYRRPDQGAGVAVVLCIERGGAVPALLVGKPLLEETSEAVARFELGRVAASLRPERVLRHLIEGPGDLEHLLEAVVAIAVGAPAAMSEGLARTVRSIERWLTPLAREQLVTIGSGMRERRTNCSVAARDWLRATDLTALRTGYALSGDLAACVGVVRAEPLSPTRCLTEARVLDLVWSSVTDEVIQVRRFLEQ